MASLTVQIELEPDVLTRMEEVLAAAGVDLAAVVEAMAVEIAAGGALPDGFRRPSAGLATAMHEAHEKRSR